MDGVSFRRSTPMAIGKTGLIATVASLIIGAAIFIYVASTLLTGLKNSNPGAAGATASATFNTSIDAMITISFTVGSLMAIAAVAVIGFWIVRDVIGA